LTGNRDLAEDILEETFCRLYKSDLKKEGKLKNWLFRVATNLSYKTNRKRKHEISNPENTVIKTKINPKEQIEKRILVQKALMKIPEKQRIVVILKFFQGMKYREIAEILNCPHNTVKTRMHGGLKKLHKLLKKDFT
jgi:RNA polymerase sigma-70 factor (ECF subfamily)